MNAKIKMERDAKKEEIAARLRSLLPYHNGVQASFARAIGASDQNVCDWLSGRNLPGSLMLARMAEAGVDVRWLLTGQSPSVSTK